MAAVDPGAFSPQALPPHPATPERGAGPNRASLRVRRIGWGTGVLLLALTFLPFPVPAPDNQVDGSLAQVLSWAWQTNALFGQDLIFTYGPLGKFIFFYYTSSAAGWRLIIDLALGVTVSLGLCLIAARLPRPWAVILILSFVWIAPNLPARADFLLNAALFCWGCLCFPKPGTRWISQRRCLRPIAGTRLVERPRLPPAPGIPKLRRLQRSPERTQ